jgi:hypothetical protein
MGLFVVGILSFSFQASAYTLKDALLQIQNLQKEIVLLKNSLKASVGDITSPSLSIYPPYDMQKTSAIIGIEVSSFGDPKATRPIVVYYGTSPRPTSLYVSIPISANSIYQYKLSNLTCGTKYYYYGSIGNTTSLDGTFTTENCAGYVNTTVYTPIISSLNSSAVTSTGATINSIFSSSSAVSEYGICFKKTIYVFFKLI